MKAILALAATALGLLGVPQNPQAGCSLNGCKATWSLTAVLGISGNRIATSIPHAYTSYVDTCDGACTCQANAGGAACVVADTNCYATVIITWAPWAYGLQTMSVSVAGCGSFDSKTDQYWNVHSTPFPTIVKLTAMCSSCDYLCPTGSGF